MTLEEAFVSEESNFRFQLLNALYSGIARQQKWVADFANWSLGTAGIYSTTLIANLDKLRPLLKPNWFPWIITFLFLSAFIGVVTRLALAWSDSVLQLQMETEAKAKEWFKLLDSQQHAWEFVRNFGKNVFKITIESARIVASKQPWPFRCFSKPMIEKVEGEMEIMFKRCFQIYWLSIWTLSFQIAFLVLAILAAGPAQGTRPLIIMPSGRSFYHRRPARYATEQKEFQRLIAELKRLSSKKGYSQEQIASEVGVTQVTVNHWLTGYSFMAQRESIERLKKFLTAHA